MPYDPPPEIASLSITKIGELIEARKLPPVESWNPERTGDSKMRINSDGSWMHEGAPITRQAMVRAFSSILRRDAKGGYFLVTPYEKLRIEVADTPFIAVDVTSQGEGADRILAFRLNTDDLVVAGPDNAITISEENDEPVPYLHVRSGLNARISRAVFYELADMAISEHENEDNEIIGLWSSGAFFAFEGNA
ncbi:DUF1285 domain-containing protein [Sphingorhabdus sp. Alg239-R122]|uniref:DUF1285 domain-containing protein n=1 Tax=Sphingorhabdus sp. Alg239-R122 TaxID=2305989 RepID=UPI0013DA6C12|nr:DUF1285 domain-containing protein [Sphingorhabdus sp. Alg239-R122]